MEFNNLELEIIQGATEAEQMIELTDLQLAVVGGGCGEVVFH